MKKIILILMSFFVPLSIYGQDLSEEAETISNDTVSESVESEVLPGETENDGAEKKLKYTKEKKVPAKKRPSAKSSDSTMQDKSEGYEKKCSDTFKYGLQDEISALIDELSKNEDTRFIDLIYDLFFTTKDLQVKSKILAYFTKLKDPCLGDYACTVINDPYDEKDDTVSACFKYVSEAKITDAVPGLIDLVDKEEETYFTGALTAVGELGGKDEALFLADYLDRNDLSVAQRQALMKVLGRMKVLETWDKLTEIARDEDENSFVRMYAAEAIGAMEKPESEEILLKLYESDDPNFRIYVIKGLSHFSSEKSNNVIMEAIRDSQYKVRMEAIDCVKEKNLKESVPSLIYRCNHKDELKAVKEKCYTVIAGMNTSEGNEYLVGLITDKKVGDQVKVKVASALLEADHAGTSEIIALAEETLKSDARKNLRYALGKEFAKYGRPAFAQICEHYIDHADVATQGTGLDIWEKGRYSGLMSKVQEIAKDAEEEEVSEKEKPKTYQYGRKKKNANARKAKRILEKSGDYDSSAIKSSVDAK